MKAEILNVLCATDEKYAPYCGVMLTSFLENHKAFHTEVYIIVKSRLKAEKRLKRLEVRYDVKVNFIEFPYNDILEPYYSNPRWSIETYYRIFAETLLPIHLDRVLYLDCDIIVDGEVCELFSMELEGVSAMVVTDAPTHVHYSHPCRLGYPEEKGYFNAGVMMINLSYWREHGILSKCLNYLREYYRKLEFCDQDLLNVILLDSKKHISVMYNFQEDLLYHGYFELYDEELKMVVLRQRPKIIHYTGYKPWSVYGYGRPLYALWQRYKRRSMWWYLTNRLPKEKPFNYFIKRYFLWPFGIYLHKKEVIITTWM